MHSYISRYVASPIKRTGAWIAAGLATEAAFARVVTGLFLAVGSVGVFHHELWRDEMHAWLVARDSSSLWNVFQVTSYEAHFALWRVLLYPLTRCTHNPMAMQFLNLLVAAGTVWIVARFSPFRRLEKVLFSFGYFPLYEYGIIAQDYSLIVILMFAFCAVYRRRTGSCLGLSVILALMANTVPYGFAIALILSAMLVVDWIVGEQSRRLRTATRRNLTASALIVLVGLGSAGLQLAFMQESPSTTWKRSLAFADLVPALTNIWRAYVPIPRGFLFPLRLVWGSNLVADGIPQGTWIAVGLSLGLMIISVGLLVRRPVALFLFALGTASLLWIQFAVSIGAPRHAGFLFLLFIASLWIGHDSEGWELSTDLVRRFGGFFDRWEHPVVVGLLVIHLAAAANMWAVDFRYPFSGNKQAAQFIRDHGLSDRVIVASIETRVSPLAGYLDRQLYYPESSRFGSYIDYSKPVKMVPAPQAVMKAWEFAQQTTQGVVMVLTYRLASSVGGSVTNRFRSGRILANGAVQSLSEAYAPPSATIQWLAHFSSFVDEHCDIYLVKRD